jgi:calcineurin-like phosphoesterase family protein
MDNRYKEEKEADKCKDPQESYSQYISTSISKTIRKKCKVWLATDWHLWLREKKGSNKCHKRSDFDDIITTYKNTVHDDDLFIYLGDLVDGEFINKEQLKDVLLELPGIKILVRGNNDVFDWQFYRSCGFQYVVRSFNWSNIVFSHYPIENNNDINIHGHIHGSRQYWCPYTNQIDVAAFNGRKEPVELQFLIKQQPAYSKTIKECPEKFNQESVNIFEQAMFNQVMYEDPFRD